MLCKHLHQKSRPQIYLKNMPWCKYAFILSLVETYKVGIHGYSSQVDVLRRERVTGPSSLLI